MMNTNTTVAVEISQQEAWYLLHLLKLKALPGLPVPEDFAKQTTLLNAVENSLVAKGLIKRDYDLAARRIELAVDEVVTALVGAGALAERVISLVYETSPLTGEVTWFCFAPSLTVMRHEPQPGVVQFSAIGDGGMLQSMIALALHLDVLQPPLAGDFHVALPAEMLQTARAAVTANEVFNLFASSGIPAEMAQPLSEIVKGYETIGRVVMSSAKDQAVSAFSFLYSAQSGYWIIIPDGPQVIMAPVLPTDITGRIADWLSATN